MMFHKKCSEGFNLIEMSIVIVIIGLIFGGILVGHDLINSVQIKKIMSDKDMYITAVNTFKLKYDCLPGDCVDSSRLFSGGINGNGDGHISYVVTKSDGTTPRNQNLNDTSEELAAWQHMSMANIVAGSFTGKVGAATSYCGNTNMSPPYSVNSPTGSYGNSSYGIWYLDVNANADMIWVYGAPFQDWSGSHVISFGECNPSVDNTELAPYTNILSTSEAYMLDSKYDDGKPGTGNMRVSYNSSCYDSARDVTQYKNSSYTLSNTTIKCGFISTAGF